MRLHAPSATHAATSAAMREGCSTMSQTIQSTGRRGRHVSPSARKCSTSGSRATPPCNSPLSIAVTLKPRCASCQVQPPGAAPRSTACMPGFSNRKRSSSVKNVIRASASLSVDRDGAECGCASRGIPIGHGLPVAALLVPTHARVAATKTTCSRKPRGSSGARSPARSAATVSGADSRRHRPERVFASLVSGVSNQIARNGGSCSVAMVSSGVTRSRSGNACGPSPTNNERANQGGVAANARSQRALSSAPQEAFTKALPATASHASSMRARVAMRRMSDTHSASKPERQCATMLRCTATKRRGDYALSGSATRRFINSAGTGADFLSQGRPGALAVAVSAAAGCGRWGACARGG